MPELLHFDAGLALDSVTHSGAELTKDAAAELRCSGTHRAPQFSTFARGATNSFKKSWVMPMIFERSPNSLNEIFGLPGAQTSTSTSTVLVY